MALTTNDPGERFGAEDGTISAFKTSSVLEKGIEKAFELLSNDTALSDGKKRVIGKILEGAIKAK